MKQTIFDIFTKNQIYFCAESSVIESSSIEQMTKCFDVFRPYGSCLFYRLTRNCKRMGYVDKTDCLIQPDEDYRHMVCLALLNSYPIECPSWVEEREFKTHLENEKLGELVREICKAGVDSGEENNDYGNYDYRDDDDVLSEEESEEYSGESYSSEGSKKVLDDSEDHEESPRHQKYSSTDSEEIIEIVIEESTISDDQIYIHNSKGKSEESILSNSRDNFVPGISESTSVSSYSDVSEYSEDSSL